MITLFLTNFLFWNLIIGFIALWISLFLNWGCCDYIEEVLIDTFTSLLFGLPITILFSLITMGA